MKHKTRGIVLHRLNYSDTSVIIQILTRDFGVRSYMVKGITGKKSASKKAVFLPLNLLELEVSHSGKEKIEMIYEARNFPLYSSIHLDVIKSCIAQYVAELLLRSLKQEDVGNELFDYIESSLLLFDSSDENGSFHLNFTLQLSRFLGFFPSSQIPGQIYFDLADGVFTQKASPLNPVADPEETMLLVKLMEEGSSVKLDRKSKKRLLHLLVRYFSYHVPGFKELNSLKVLEEVLA